MKKLAFLLGSILIVGNVAAAKEVVPAPVVVEEAPVQVIEKEVIVYRDKPEGFRPNGYVDLHYKYYGDAEELNYKNDGKTNNYGRVELKGMINMTENQSLEYRIRDYNSWNNSGSDTDKGIDGTETRLRYFYNHGYLGDSKVNLTSRVHYQDNGHDDDSQEIEYQARFDFGEYMFNGDFVKTDYFVVAPKYKYAWASNNDDYDNQVGADLYTMHTLPWGFSFEFNVYATQHFYGKDQATSATDKTDDNFSVDVEAYLYNTTNLYTNDKFAIDFQFEGGFDPYTWNSESVLERRYKDNYLAADDDKADTLKYEDTKYRLYAWPQIVATYNATENFKTYVSLGAEYTNGYKYESDSQDWRWQPVAVVGFKTTF